MKAFELLNRKKGKQVMRLCSSAEIIMLQPLSKNLRTICSGKYVPNDMGAAVKHHIIGCQGGRQINQTA